MSTICSTSATSYTVIQRQGGSRFLTRLQEAAVQFEFQETYGTPDHSLRRQLRREVMAAATPPKPLCRKRRASNLSGDLRPSKRQTPLPHLPPPQPATAGPSVPPAPSPPTPRLLRTPAPSSIPPSTSLPPHVPAKRQKKKSKASEAYSSRRLLQHRERKSLQTPQVTLQKSLADFPKLGEYRGKGVSGVKREPGLCVPAGDEWPETLGARVLDADHLLIGCRAYGGTGYQPIINNTIITNAVRYLEAHTRPQFSGDHKRGCYDVRLLMIHRTQRGDPVHNVYMKENLSHIVEFARQIEPVIHFTEKFFQSNFPNHHAHYSAVMKDLTSHPNLSEPLCNLFGPWTSCCVNSGGRVCTLLHCDCDNYIGNFCIIIPFKFFDYRKSAKLVIDLGDGEPIAFDLPPGIPFVLPSSLIAHYNTAIVGDDEERGSLVLWTSGKVIQWLELGGRSRGSLTRAEVQEWVSQLQCRMQEMIDRYEKFGPTSM